MVTRPHPSNTPEKELGGRQFSRKRYKPPALCLFPIKTGHILNWLSGKPATILTGPRTPC